ncbi:MAG: hypothetical protein AAB440_00600 [Patescibacteria group bacterium]
MDNPDRVTYFAATDTRGKRIPFGIKQRDRARHMYVIGKSGVGKTTMIDNMAIQDIRNGEGFAYLDPHGGSAERLLDYVPQSRVRDVIYFAPYETEHPLALNIIEDVPYEKRHLVLSSLMGIFKSIWADSWTPRFEYVLSNTLLALLEHSEATLLSVTRLYNDESYRKEIVDNLKDPIAKKFWTNEYPTADDLAFKEAISAITGKIDQMALDPLMRSIIGSPKSSFNMRRIMDERKILLINLPKGLVGETNMQLIGSILATRIFLAAMSRADMPAAKMPELPHFYFYVDEFQNFSNHTFSEILSEARKYRLDLIISHQYIGQMDPKIQAAIFGNVGTLVSFRVGPFDAEILEHVFAPEFKKEGLMNLGRAQIYLSLMIDNVGSRPFSAVTISPIEPPARSWKQEVKRASEEQYCGMHDHQVARSLWPEGATGNLKSLVRAMTEIVKKDKEKHVEEKKAELKTTLEQVLNESLPDTAPISRTGPAPFEVPEEELRAVFKEDV